MQEFRKFVKGPVGITLLILFTIPFIITGFYGYFQAGPTTQAVAEINGVPIQRDRLVQTVGNLRERMRQESPQLDPALLDSFVNPGMVLQGMINEELIAQHAAEVNMIYSKQQAATQVRDVPVFQDGSGRFDPDVMERFLRGRGMTPASFLQDIQRTALINQYRAAFHITGFALPTELQEQRRLAEQQRDLVYVVQSLADMQATQQVSDEEIAQWYEANKEQFMEPEKLKLAYVVATPDRYRDQVTVTDEQVEAEYETRRQALAIVAQKNQRRRAAHILIKQDDRTSQEVDRIVADIQARLDAGESFADLASEFSEDIATASQGGGLGLLAQGDLPDALDQVIFSLEAGDVSGPVVSDAGTHLLKLESVEQRQMPSFEEMADTIRADILKHEAQALLAEDTHKLETLLFEHPDLQQPAAEVGLEIQTTDWFTPGAPEGFAAQAAVRNAISSAQVQEGQNSDLLEIGEGRYAAIRIAERQPPALQPLSAVRAGVEQALRRSKALAALDDMAQQARSAVATGESGVDDLAGQWSLTVARLEDINRRSQQGPRELIQEAFSVPRAETGEQAPPRVLRLANGDLAVLQVVAVRDGGGNELTSQQTSMALAELGSVEGQRTFRDVLNGLREEADLSVHEKRLPGNELEQPEDAL